MNSAGVATDMDSSTQTYLFIFIALLMLSAFVAWIVLTSKESNKVRSNEALMEVLIWGGGFIIYAIIDYLIFMH